MVLITRPSLRFPPFGTAEAPPSAPRLAGLLLTSDCEEVSAMNRTVHVGRLALIGVLLLALPSPALANWWIVRSSDKKCLVVDIEPMGKDKSVTKIGEKVYLTREEAEEDVKRLCK